MRIVVIIILTLSFYVVTTTSCRKENKVDDNSNDTTSVDTSYHTTPYSVLIPFYWPDLPSPVENPLTYEGVSLGRKLFYDPILSANNQQSCASCHAQSYGFTDNGKQFSVGIDNIAGTRQAMPIFNLAWVEKFSPSVNGRPLRFFWDGGATNLESQVMGPITNPIEMHDSLVHVLAKLQAHNEYPSLFKKAFGSSVITSSNLFRAIAQFERTIVSYRSKFDKFLFNSDRTPAVRFDSTVFTAEEKHGFNVFMDESKGDCFHCHPVSSPFLTDFQFHNNGHLSNDDGLKRITNNADDKGKFRSSSLRNLVFTAPYMHDGRFDNLDSVVEFYNSKASRVYPADPFITKHPTGLNLTQDEKKDLVLFLKTMTDSSMIVQPEYSKP